ncbi:hypothetical protein B0O80DRAFT_489015 [Mortierella sp. GBAus27b]|nr:hypothetical protein BGX31_009976 [Mortierella sp. GBA43]KAI8350520.1 hypothetical protein B0O80DRAFT_489015 [Mortierella sp. GBAus27b]
MDLTPAVAVHTSPEPSHPSSDAAQDQQEPPNPQDDIVPDGLSPAEGTILSEPLPIFPPDTLPKPSKVVSGPISTSAYAVPRRSLSSASTIHRRNQSQSLIGFPTLNLSSVMPPKPSVQSYTQINPFNLHVSGRSASVPTTPGLAPHPADNNQTSHTASQEKETYTLSDRTSNLVKTKGQVPPPLVGSSSIIHNNHMYVFGGKPVGGNPTNDLYMLNLESLEWTLVSQHHERPDCQEDEAKTSESEDTNQSRPPGDIRPSTDGLDETSNPMSHVQDGQSLSPAPRYYHSAVLVTAPPLLDASGTLSGWGDEDAAHMVIFGGRTLLSHPVEGPSNNNAEKCLSDTHILDLKKLRWIPSNLNDAAPLGMGTAATAECADAELQPTECASSALERSPLGTIPTRDLSQDKDRTSPTNAPNIRDPYHLHKPQPRFAHLAALSGDHMIIFGGRDDNKDCVHEISVLDLKTHVWLKGGASNGESCQSRTAMVSVDERPMVRRRRRYLECLATEYYQSQQPPLSSVSSSSLNTSIVAANDGATDKRDGPSPAPPNYLSAMTSPFLNPRKNTWHRGEGQPFETPLFSAEERTTFKSDSGLSLSMDQDSDALNKEGGPSADKSPPSSTDSHGNDPDHGHSQTATVSPQPSVASSVTRDLLKVVSSAMSITSSGSFQSRSRSHSHVSTTISIQSGSSGDSQGRTKSNPPTPVTHAVPRKFFAKSNGSMFDLDNLATTIAREQKVPTASQQPPPPPLSPKSKDGSSRATISRELSFSPLKRHNSSTSSSSRRSSGYMDDAKAVWRTQGSAIAVDVDEISDKRRSLDSVMDVISLSDGSFNDDKPTEKLPSFPAPVYQPLFMYSNQVGSDDHKLKRAFTRIQRAKLPHRSHEDTIFYDIRPEWTALDLECAGQGGPKDSLPPRMHFPVAHIVDRCFLVSGASMDDETAPPSSPPANTDAADPALETLDPSSGGLKRHSYSVWMHQFHSHHWTQLELSKSLRTGKWSMSVLDRDNNYLYILGQWINDCNDETPNAPAPEEQTNSSGTISEDPVAIVSFTHMIKVDLEGLEMSLPVDEPSVGPSGVRLGLEMLKDGVGADVVLVSSADGGRVRVNSAIVGQRWGYFQTLMEEHDRIRNMATKEGVVSNDGSAQEAQLREEDSAATPLSDTEEEDDHERSWKDLNDQPAEISVRETTPILVGFLQYLYTNDLTTPHQLKLRTLQGLLVVAHLYDLSRLRQLVKRALCQQLNASNAPMICEIAVLTNEFGLHTRAIRTLLQSTRMAQLRRQGEAAEAKRRMEFAMSRLGEYEEEQKRKESMRAIHQMMHQSGSNVSLISNASSTGTSGGFASRLTQSGFGGSILTPGTFRQGSSVSSSSGLPSLGSFGRLFRREESTESVGATHKL